MIEQKMEKAEVLQKRIDNYKLYVYTDLFDDLKLTLLDCDGISEKSCDLLRRLSKSLNRDVGHLQCDDVYRFYIVEEGFNYND